MRVLCLCILVFLGMALAIRSDDHGVLLETGVDKASMEMSLAVNQAVLSAQESLLNAVQQGVVVTDGQIDAAVKAAFEPIFSKCEMIVNAKEQRKCLLNVAAAKKTTKKGCKASAKGCKKHNKTKKAAPKPNKTVAAVPKTVVKKDKVAADADLAKKHAAKAKAFKAKADKHAKLAKEAAAKLKKDAKKAATKAKKAAKKVAKKVAKAAPKNVTAKSAKKSAKKAVSAVAKAKAALKKAVKKAKKAKKTAKKADAKEAEKASFVSEAEFAEHVLDAEAATEDALDMTRENIVVFLEQAMALQPSLDAASHLETINVSMLDMASLEIPEVNTNEIDSLLEQAELHASIDASSLIESGVEVETEAEVEAPEVASLAEVEAVVQKSEIKADQTALSATGVESHEALVAAAEAEMNRDLNAVKKDVLDLSDLEAIPEL